MHWFIDSPIRRKLMLITVLASAIALLMAGVVIVSYDVYTYRAQKQLEIAVQAEILAASVAPSLVFSDPKAAQEYLNALQANPEIAAAALYAADGAPFASYARPDRQPQPQPARAEGQGQRFVGDDLVGTWPIQEKQRQVGSVYLRLSTEPMLTRMVRYGGIILLVMIGSLLISLPSALRLHAVIVQPIRDIAEAARLVAAGEIVVRPAGRARADEIGLLQDKFREMALSLQEKVAIATRIASGDLLLQVVPRSGQDVLGKAFAAMVLNLREMNREIGEGVDVLASSSSAILAGTTQVAAGASEAA